VLTLQKADDKGVIGIKTGKVGLDSLLEKEWLLTNTRGGYASSSIVGCNTRQYHGLLVGALEPPVNRILALSNCLETIEWGLCKFELATNEFPDKVWPEGFLRLKSFRRDTGVQFHYEIGEMELTKSVYLLRDRDMVAVVYDFSEVEQPMDFSIRPFVALRDFHSLQKSNPLLSCKEVAEGIVVSYDQPKSAQLIISCPEAAFEKDVQWWFNFCYRVDRERGQDFSEDLYSPGVYRCRIDSARRIVLWADLGEAYRPGHFVLPDIEEVVQQLREHNSSITAAAKGDKVLAALYRAADQFVVKRVSHGAKQTTILAGFPWFADWGRDAFISLPGLLLATRRFDEAKSVLLTFARAESRGMIPNCFDDYSDRAHFNSVDASLWFINAAFAYLEASKDNRGFEEELLPVIIGIIEAYRDGTRFGIVADSDGLITAGDSDTQITWMDAKFDGFVFTPRYGKVVEVNALWYNAIMLLEHFLTDDPRCVNPEFLEALRSRGDTIRDGFRGLFWNESWGWLNDCVLPDGTADATLRPNQIFAVSLPYSPLEPAQQKAVVDIVGSKLLTPFGLRTLSPDDARYQGTYAGGQHQRDRAYHQGTVWAYLIGPFVEAYLKVNGPKAKKQAGRFIEPLLKQLTDDGCIGQVSEIYDGDAPHRPKGCFAQAWSVAEVIRAYLMVRD